MAVGDLQRSGMKFGHGLNQLGCHFFPGEKSLGSTYPPHITGCNRHHQDFFPFLVGNPFNQIAPRPQNSDLSLMVTVIGGLDS